MTDPRVAKWLDRGHEDNDVVGIGLTTEPQDDWLYVPGAIFSLLLAIGRAYGLRYLGSITFYEDVELNSTQCESVPEELEFVAHVLNDPAVPDVAAAVANAAARCARTPNGVLKIEFP